MTRYQTRMLDAATYLWPSGRPDRDFMEAPPPAKHWRPGAIAASHGRPLLTHSRRSWRAANAQKQSLGYGPVLTHLLGSIQRVRILLAAPQGLQRSRRQAPQLRHRPAVIGSAISYLSPGRRGRPGLRRRAKASAGSDLLQHPQRHSDRTAVGLSPTSDN